MTQGCNYSSELIDRALDAAAQAYRERYHEEMFERIDRRRLGSRLRLYLAEARKPRESLVFAVTVGRALLVAEEERHFQEWLAFWNRRSAVTCINRGRIRGAMEGVAPYRVPSVVDMFYRAYDESRRAGRVASVAIQAPLYRFLLHHIPALRSLVPEPDGTVDLSAIVAVLKRQNGRISTFDF